MLIDEFQKLAADTLKIESENLNLLVAKFIVENPELRADQIELVRRLDGFEIIFTVRKKSDVI